MEEKKEELVSFNKDLFADLSISELEERLELEAQCWIVICGGYCEVFNVCGAQCSTLCGLEGCGYDCPCAC
ncbi:MAG: hypothetical protein WC879_16520 [Melioribacteraceae bacterium]